MTRGKTAERGYGAAHQKLRADLEPIVAAGRALCTEPICLMKTRRIAPGAPWDLAHNRNTGGYRGPAHRRCNRAEGARWRHRLRRKALMPATTPKRRAL